MEGYGNENPGAFQPTRPLRGATEIAHKLTDTIKFQPTRPLRGATPCFHRGIAQSKFQPTRPLRGATSDGIDLKSRLEYFNPRAPCGARPRWRRYRVTRRGISTHAPLAGRDSRAISMRADIIYFNPRAPCGARLSFPWLNVTIVYFNPRAPCGARPRRDLPTTATFIFQPTRPLRGATVTNGGKITDMHFNPRAPCGARLLGASFCGKDTRFQPTRPLRGATSEGDICAGKTQFQPTRPLRGATQPPQSDYQWLCISTHAPLAGRDSKSVQITMHIFAITDKFQMLLHRMPPVRAFCSFLMQENHADFGCEPPK